jgi:hypothetical protein
MRGPAPRKWCISFNGSDVIERKRPLLITASSTRVATSEPDSAYKGIDEETFAHKQTELHDRQAPIVWRSRDSAAVPQ